MATRKTRNATRSRTSRTSHDLHPEQLQQAAQEGTHRQMVKAVDAASALLHGAEILGRVQLRAIERSSQAWREAADRLHAATGPMDVIATQNQLVMNIFMQGMQLAQEMMQAGAALQPATAAVQQEQPAGAAMQSMNEMMQAPAMRAWQTMFNPMGMNGAAPHGSN